MIFPKARWTGGVWSQDKNSGTALEIETVHKAQGHREGVLHPAPPPPNSIVKAPLHIHAALAGAAGLLS